MEVQVRTLQEDILPSSGLSLAPFAVQSSTTVEQLQTLIHQHWKVHPFQQVLWCNTVLLVAGELGKCGASSNNPILVGFATATIRVFVVKPRGGKEKLENANLNATFNCLKKIALAGLNPRERSVAQIAYGEKQLDWNTKLREIEGLTYDSELRCTILDNGGA